MYSNHNIQIKHFAHLRRRNHQQQLSVKSICCVSRNYIASEHSQMNYREPYNFISSSNNLVSSFYITADCDSHFHSLCALIGIRLARLNYIRQLVNWGLAQDPLGSPSPIHVPLHYFGYTVGYHIDDVEHVQCLI